MTEYPNHSVRRTPDAFLLRRNRIGWVDDHLELHIDDVTSPFPKAVQGKVRVFPSAFNRRAFALDRNERHVWWPIAPTSRIEVDFGQARWAGRAYLDSNWGVEPLERGFVGWNWSRSSLPQQTVVHYITEDHHGAQHALAVEFDGSGDGRDRAAYTPKPLPRSGWGIAREAVSQTGSAPECLEILEDTPFYSRQRIFHQIDGLRVEAMHESLDLRRFDSRWVQTLLPFKIRRARR